MIPRSNFYWCHLRETLGSFPHPEGLSQQVVSFQVEHMLCRVEGCGRLGIRAPKLVSKGAISWLSELAFASIGLLADISNMFWFLWTVGDSWK